ncbi:MAG: chorismate mutase [Clostridia bacterium]|nr:chorismate mutase [Clostridia bacterium]
MGKLDESRKKINGIDREIAALFEKRMGFVKEIAGEKINGAKAVYDPEREKTVISNAVASIDNPELSDYTAEFFKDLIEVSKKYQHDIMPLMKPEKPFSVSPGSRAGYQGAAGSYTEQAFRWVYPGGTEPISYQKLEDLFNAIASGEIESGVVPYENSSTGGVNSVTDMMRNYDLYIKAETEVRIEHCLLGIRGALLRDIKYAYSHPQGLNQCSGFFDKNPGITECSYANTAFAARDVAKWGDPANAAIASRSCAAIYGLDIIRENIQDNNRNKTRFIVISADPEPTEDAVKTSILFTSNHTPGALYKILEPFYEDTINITRIESRPNPRRSFEYFFYLDFNGSTADPDIIHALNKARESCGYFRILGSYRVL